MTLAAGRHPISSAAGALDVLTTRAGVASRVGHDLRIRFGSWTGEIVAEDAGVHVEVDVDLQSFQVIEGTGGLVPLTPIDRASITRTAMGLLGVQHERTAHFSSTGVAIDGAHAVVSGDLTLGGHSAPIQLDAHLDGGSCTATGSMLQSALGIAPYKAFFGALRLADEVTIDIRVTITGS